MGFVDCDTAFFDDDCFDFEDVVHVCDDIPCLFLAYNKKKIHVYFRIPKVYISSFFLGKIIYIVFIFFIINFNYRKSQKMRSGLMISGTNLILNQLNLKTNLRLKPLNSK